MHIQKSCLSFILLSSIVSISAMQGWRDKKINNIIAPELMPTLDTWYTNKYITSTIAQRAKKAFNAAAYNSVKLYYLLMKQPILAQMQNSNGESLLSELLRHRHHVTQGQAKFLLGCPFNLDLDINANDSLFYRMIMFLQTDLMTELLRHANFQVKEKHLSIISWIIDNNLTIDNKTMQWWLDIKQKITSKLKATEK